ncbi:MAG: hypothetical protein WA254_05795 [Candidatus Sulfotelmatobacter sp.]
MSAKERKLLKAVARYAWHASLQGIPLDQCLAGVETLTICAKTEADLLALCAQYGHITQKQAELVSVRRVQQRAKPERSAEEKARARRRLLDGRRRSREAYEQLHNRPLWQAMKDFPVPTIADDLSAWKS